MIFSSAGAVGSFDGYKPGDNFARHTILLPLCKGGDKELEALFSSHLCLKVNILPDMLPYKDCSGTECLGSLL